MASGTIAGALARRNVHYGWVVVGVTFLTMLVMAGAVGAPGVFIGPLAEEFGWSTAEISAALAVRLALFGLMGPFAAAFLNHFGMRKVMVTAVSIVLAGLIGSLFMTDVWQLVLAWGIVVGFGVGLTAMVLGATVATRWFSARRGLVVGILAASTATGQLVFLPALAALTEALGWRVSVTLICAALVLAAVVVLLFMRDRPSDVGLPVYGETAVTPPPPQNTNLSSLLTSPIGVLADAAKTPVFWILFATFFVCGASTNGLIQTHFIAFCGDYGMIAVAAASVLAMMGVFDFIGTIGSGWLSDRYDPRWLLFWYYGLRGLSLLYLPQADFTIFGLSGFAVFYGLDWIATVPPTVKLCADHFGERANIVFGWVFAGHQLGAATIALSAGVVRTELGSYNAAFIAAGLLCIAAAMLVLTLRRGPAPRLQPA